MDYEQVLVYIQALPEEVQQAMQEAIDRAISQQVMREHRRYLQGGLES